jgi:hypothetical protein
MKKLEKLRHPEKTDFQAKTSITITQAQHNFIKRENLNLSRIVRGEIDRLIKLFINNNKAV